MKFDELLFNTLGPKIDLNVDDDSEDEDDSSEEEDRSKSKVFQVYFDPK